MVVRMHVVHYHDLVLEGTGASRISCLKNSRTNSLHVRVHTLYANLKYSLSTSVSVAASASLINIWSVPPIAPIIVLFRRKPQKTKETRKPKTLKPLNPSRFVSSSLKIISFSYFKSIFLVFFMKKTRNIMN